MKNGFVKYVVATFIVIFLVAIMDQTVGVVMDCLSHSIPVTQDMGKGRFGRESVSSDIVVVGSSRASHHYDVNRMADSLGCSVYNVGLDGCFFLDNCCMMHAILERYSPKMILLEISCDALYQESKNYLEGLYAYYWQDPYVKEIVNHEEGWLSGIKLLSCLYTYNANAFKTIGYGLKGVIKGDVEVDPLHGYAPLAFKPKKSELVLKSHTDDNPHSFTISSWKVSLLTDLLRSARGKGVQVVVITSPVFGYRNVSNQESQMCITQICENEQSIYWDFSDQAEFLQHPEWFNDGAHLNEIGAAKFTELVLDRLMLH